MKKGYLLAVLSFLALLAILSFVVKSKPVGGVRPQKTGIIATTAIRANITVPLKSLKGFPVGDQLGGRISKAVYSKISDQIKLEEYNITYQRNNHSYQSPNRMHNLRITYSEDGVSISPRVKAKSAALITADDQRLKLNSVVKPHQPALPVKKEANDWCVKMRLSGYGRGGADQKFSGTKINAFKNKAFTEDKMLRIEYENSPEGMRQNFVVKSRPEGKGQLKIALAVKSNLDFTVQNDDVCFINDKGESKLRYCDLKVFDARGKKLNSWFTRPDYKSFMIVVNDKDADYPVTIDPLSISPNWNAIGGQGEAYFGQRLAMAGDVNGDGYSDVIVGANCYDNGQTDEGRAFLYLGSASGVVTTAAWTAEGNAEAALLGHTVASAGDVNKDGYSDVIVGVPGYSNGQSSEGAVFVYYGSASGLPATASWMKEGNSADAYFGNSVSTAGDVNGDGYSDIIVGAPYYSSAFYQPQEGKAFVYHGSASGLGANAAWTVESNSFTTLLGFSVSTAGDVNKDGYSDVIIGVPGYSNGQGYEGRALVYFGNNTGIQTTGNWAFESGRDSNGLGFSVGYAGDVNKDGYSDVIAGVPDYTNGEAYEGAVYLFYGNSAGLPAAPNKIIESNLVNASFGKSTAAAGDVNKDGYEDLLVGAPGYSNGNSGEGAAFLYYGTASGIPDAAGWMVEGGEDSASLGYSVGGSGDVNKDGYKDLLIGAPGHSDGFIKEGQAVVYHGSNTGPLPVELISFSGEVQENNVVLRWETASEINNYGFDIERMQLAGGAGMTAGNPILKDQWKVAGFIKGAGNSNSHKSYSFTDAKLEAGKYVYRLKQTDNDGVYEYSDILEIDVTMKSSFELMQNNPNPCNPASVIGYTLPERAHVILKLYDAAGRQVAVLADEMKSPGQYRHYFNGRDLSSGVYIYSLTAGRYKAAKKMIVIR